MNQELKNLKLGRKNKMSELNKTEQQENGLVVLLKANNISEEMALQISPAFSELFDLATEWNKKAKEYLSNPEFSQEEKAKHARTARLALVKVRTGIEKKRKELNEEDQKRISDRNLIGKVLINLVVPTEEMLEAEEKRVENEEKERKEAIKQERLKQIEPYQVDCTFFDLANMPEDAFNTLLENSSLAFEHKSEKERIEKRTNERKEQLVLLGFKPHQTGNETAYIHELFDVEQEDILNYSDEQWKRFADNLAKDISELVEKRRKEKEDEEKRLKAEKDEADRKLLLIQQEQKEKEKKHNDAVYRQQAAARMNIVLEYTIAHEMTEQGWCDWFKEKNSEYEAEQNRLFIEQKKKEREEAIAKAENERIEKEKIEAAKAPIKDQLNKWVNGFSLGNPISENDTTIQIEAKFEEFRKWAKSLINQI